MVGWCESLGGMQNIHALVSSLHKCWEHQTVHKGNVLLMYYVDTFIRMIVVLKVGGSHFKYTLWVHWTKKIYSTKCLHNVLLWMSHITSSYYCILNHTYSVRATNEFNGILTKPFYHVLICIFYWEYIVRCIMIVLYNGIPHSIYDEL